MTDVNEYHAKALDVFNEIGRAAHRDYRKILCDNPLEMTDEPLGQHTIGSRPNSCWTCLRTRENCK